MIKPDKRNQQSRRDPERAEAAIWGRETTDEPIQLCTNAATLAGTLEYEVVL